MFLISNADVGGRDPRIGGMFLSNVAPLLSPTKRLHSPSLDSSQLYLSAEESYVSIL